MGHDQVSRLTECPHFRGCTIKAISIDLCAFSKLQKPVTLVWKATLVSLKLHSEAETVGFL